MKVGHWYSFEKHSYRKKNNAWGRRQRYSGKRRSLIEIRQPPQQNNTVKSIFKWLHRWWNPHWQRRCKMLEKNSIYNDDERVVPVKHPMLILHWWRMMEWWYYFKRPLHWRRRCMSTSGRNYWSKIIRKVTKNCTTFGTSWSSSTTSADETSTVNFHPPLWAD